MLQKADLALAVAFEVFELALGHAVADFRQHFQEPESTTERQLAGKL
jgi:hypothetical protein